LLSKISALNAFKELDNKVNEKESDDQKKLETIVDTITTEG